MTDEKKLLRPLTSADIETLFGKPAGWWDRDRVRKRYYAMGFPHPFERGMWSAEAIKAWMLTAGRNADRVAPKVKPKRKQAPRRPTRAAYAPVAQRH